MAVTSLLDLVLQSIDTGLEGGLVSGPSTHRRAQLSKILDGTTAGKANLVYSDRRTVAGSGTESLDLAGGLVKNGLTYTFTSVLLLALWNLELTDGWDLEVGPGASNGWTPFFGDASDRVVLPAGVSADLPGLVLFFDPNGRAVTAGTGDIVDLDNITANDVDVDIFIVGRGSRAD